MKKSVKIFIVLSLVFLLAVISVPASASWISKITGTIFGFVLRTMGFTEDLDGYCWFCPIARTLFRAADTVCLTIQLKMRNVLLMLLGVGTLFFIAFKVASTVIKLQEVDLMQFMGEMFKTLGRVIIAAALLTEVDFISRELLTPILGFALQFSLELLDNMTIHNKLYTSLNKSMDFSTDATYQSNLAKAWAYIPGQGVLSGYLEQSVIAVMARASANFVVGMAVGLVLMMISTLSSMVLPDFQNALSGGIIFFSFAALYITVPFQLINYVVQLAFVVALLPFWIILWVFPITGQYVKNAFNMFLQTSLSFMVFGVMLVLVMQLVGKMLPNSSDILNEMIPGYEWIAGRHASALSGSILVTLALSFLCKELLKGAAELSSRITQVYGISMGEEVGRQMTGVAGSTVAGGVAGLFVGAKGVEAMKKSFTGDVDAAQDLQKGTQEWGSHLGKKYVGGGATGWLFGQNNSTVAAVKDVYNVTQRGGSLPEQKKTDQNNNQGSGSK